MALRESHKDTFVDAIKNNIIFKYGGTTYTLEVVRAYSDIPDTPPIASISFIPTGEKTGLSLAHFISKRDNIYYKNYGYWDVEMIVVRVFSKQMNSIDGRNLSDTWLRQIENYIKVNWYNIINEATIVRSSFTTPKLLIVQGETDVTYGFEIRFKIISPNIWTDEPEVDPITPYPVEEIIVDDPQNIRVEK
jgi:hypothetical protein